MSFQYYSNWWILKKQQLEELYERDRNVAVAGRILKDKNVTTQLLGGLYAEYSMVVQEIDTCLDQLAQVLKNLKVNSRLYIFLVC